MVRPGDRVRHDDAMPDTDTPTRHSGRVGRVLGWVAVIGVLGGAGLVVTALALSLVINGSSMEPTLHNGDRVLLDTRAGIDDVERFDVVNARVGEGSLSVVKRVIALSGDDVAIRPATDDRPLTVWVRPDGVGAWREVVNEAWQPHAETGACCAPDGTSGQSVRVATVPPDSLFLLGDNLGHSDDSREFGWVPAERLHGVFAYRLLPLERAGELPGDPDLAAAHAPPPGHGSAS